MYVNTVWYKATHRRSWGAKMQKKKRFTFGPRSIVGYFKNKSCHSVLELSVMTIPYWAWKAWLGNIPFPPGYPPRSPTSCSPVPECHKLSNHCLILCYNDIYNGAQLVHILPFDSVFRLPCGKSKHVIITIDIPSMDKSRNIFHEMFRRPQGMA